MCRFCAEGRPAIYHGPAGEASGASQSGIGTWDIAPTSDVPEPASLTLSLSALLALALMGRKRLAASRGSSNR